YKLRHGEEGRRFGAPFHVAVATRGRLAKPFLFDSITLLLHPFRFETRRFTPCRFRIAMGGRVLHERNAGGVMPSANGSPLRSPSPPAGYPRFAGEARRDGGEAAEPSRHRCAFHPQSSCSPGAKRKRDFDSRRIDQSINCQLCL